MPTRECPPNQTVLDAVAPTITVLSRTPDPDDDALQSVCVEINGVRCVCDEAPISATTSDALNAWVHETYSDVELAALAVANASTTSVAAPTQYFALRTEDIQPPLLRLLMYTLLRRLNAVEVAANMSPTSIEQFLDACVAEATRP